MAGTYKIMIADDFPILREDLAEVIKEQPDMQVRTTVRPSLQTIRMTL